MARTNASREKAVPIAKLSPYSKRSVLILTPLQRRALTHILRDALQQANDTLVFIQDYPRGWVDNSTKEDGKAAKEIIRQLQPILDALESI